MAVTQSEEWPSGLPCKPSFMVIGAPKCGSTSLFHYLAAHPNVHQPGIKELCYFSDFKRHLQHYRTTPAMSWDLYTAGFAGADSLRTARLALASPSAYRSQRKRPVRRLLFGASWRKAAKRQSAAGPSCEAAGRRAFEGCPFYLGEARAPVRLQATFPGLRVVAVLRNPWVRTLSAFHDYVRHGRISEAAHNSQGMERLIIDKVELVRSGHRSMEDFDVRILTSGVYIYGLKAWGQHWPSADMLLVRSEDMFNDTAGVLSRLEHFLQLPHFMPPADRLQARMALAHCGPCTTC
mmetsp:Transcript_55665/g.165609  ORF Transcript_55665/g.165609 Transcript_55665/m.165609 type:complete len:293 (-) Transcript_55665:503-1381(-)